MLKIVTSVFTFYSAFHHWIYLIAPPHRGTYCPPLSIGNLVTLDGRHLFQVDLVHF